MRRSEWHAAALKDVASEIHDAFYIVFFRQVVSIYQKAWGRASSSESTALISVLTDHSKTVVEKLVEFDKYLDNEQYAEKRLYGVIRDESQLGKIEQLLTGVIRNRLATRALVEGATAAAALAEAVRTSQLASQTPIPENERRLHLP